MKQVNKEVKAVSRRMSKRDQEKMADKIMSAVSEQTIGELIGQMGTLIIRRDHLKQVHALVDRFHGLTEEIPSNFVALAAVIFAQQSVSMCLSIAEVMKNEKKSESVRYFEGLLSQADEIVKLAKPATRS